MPIISSTRRAPHGQAAIIIALALTLLLCATALGVDGARFYAEGLRVQKAADQAALVGVTQAAINGAAGGQVSATDIVTRNLTVSNPTTVTVATSYTNATTGQERVVVQEQKFPFLFAPVVGIKYGTITREATANYTAPLPMGNPTNQLGNTGDSDPGNSINSYKADPSGLASSATAASLPQNMMLAINGPYQYTESGDPYAPLYVLSNAPWTTSPISMTNPFRPSGFDGYNYKVTIPAGSVPAGDQYGATYIQVYDAQACYGDKAGDQAGSGGFGLPSPPPMHYLYPDNYPTYYRLYDYSGNNLAHVSAAELFNPSRGPSPAVPSNTLPPDTVIAPPDADLSGSGYTYRSCDSNYTVTDSSDPTYGAGKWHTLAEVNVNPSQSSSYVVNVTTCLNSPTLNMYDPANRDSTNTGGTLYNCHGTEVNNFALRAVTVTDGSNGCATLYSPPNSLDCKTFSTSGVLAQPTLAGLGRVSISVSCPSACSGRTTPIYLSKVDPIYAGKYLLIKLFDPGDVNGASSLQIVRPNGTFAPFEWYTETLDGSGQPFQTAVHNHGDESLITSFPITTTYTMPPTDTNPLSSTYGKLVCPSDSPSFLTVAAPAYGQTMGESNPFDPATHGITDPTQPCAPSSEYKSWSGQANTPSGHNSAYPSYDLHQYQFSSYGNYAPFNGRWVYIFTQIPTDYGSPGSPNYYAPSGNPNPGWWYVQYDTEGANSFSDRTTWETQIINTPPHLTN